MKESLAKNWISGLIITTAVTFIQHMDTARRFRLERSITKIMLHIYTQFDMGDDLFVSYVVNLYKQLTYMLSDEIIRVS